MKTALLVVITILGVVGANGEYFHHPNGAISFYKQDVNLPFVYTYYITPKQHSNNLGYFQSPLRTGNQFVQVLNQKLMTNGDSTRFSKFANGKPLLNVASKNDFVVSNKQIEAYNDYIRDQEQEENVRK
ncbi:hypothetical protein PPYR_05126 [Photinus pyralis]|uniref:Uncharacterized protein n=1 Tax=Photinus pyralis TaxID=7054 RepID=A0A1Y1MF43_PHOPY|nr:hypothetical protein PPYR_05126 [Photinus pyralis]